MAKMQGFKQEKEGDVDSRLGWSNSEPSFLALERGQYGGQKCKDLSRKSKVLEGSGWARVIRLRPFLALERGQYGGLKCTEKAGKARFWRVFY